MKINFGNLILIILYLFFTISLFSQTLDKDEASYYWYINGKHYYKTGDIPKAVTSLKKALRYNPHNDLAQRLLLKIKKENPYIEDIAVNSNDFSQKGESFQWYVNAKYLYDKRLYRKAIESLNRALRLNPYNVKAIELKNKIEKIIGINSKNIKNKIEKKEEIGIPFYKTDEITTLFNSAKFYFKWNKLEKAYKILKKIDKFSSIPPELKEQITLLTKEVKNKLEQKKGTKKKISNKSAYWFWLGKYYEKKKDLEKAYLCYQKAAIGNNSQEIKDSIDRVKRKLFFTTSNSKKNTLKSSDFQKEVKIKLVTENHQKNNNVLSENMTAETEELESDEKPETDINNQSFPLAKKNTTDDIIIDKSLLDGIVFDRGKTSMTVEVEDDFIDKLQKKFSKKADTKDLFSLEKEKLTEIIFTDQKEITSKIPTPPDREKKYEKKFKMYDYKKIVQAWQEMKHAPLPSPQISPPPSPQKVSSKLPPDIKAKIKSYFEKGDFFLNKKDYQEGLQNYRAAYITTLENDSNDINSLYNLMLIYYKQKKYELSSLLLFQLGRLLPQYQQKKEYAFITAQVKCWLNQIILQSAINNYNLAVQKQPYNASYLGEGKLNIKFLIKKNFLPAPPVHNISLDLNWENRQIHLIYDILTYKCEQGYYFLDSHGVIHCNIHKTSPFLLISHRRIENEQVTKDKRVGQLRGYQRLLKEFNFR